MATYEKILLSGSSNGLGIKIGQTATPGNTVHTSHATSLDEIWLYAVNSQSASVKLTLEWGQDVAPDGNIEVTIPGESGLYLVSPGLLLTNELVVKAFASSGSVVIINGFVNRITA